MLSQRQQHCLRGIGIEQWVKRSAMSLPEEPLAATARDSSQFSPDITALSSALRKNEVKQTPVVTPPPATTVEFKLDSWDEITRSIHQCQACPLATECTQKVPGVGIQTADLMIIGEGPGHDEDIKGEPFVGRSGLLLDKMLHAIGFSRSQVFITNIVKCRPPNNRDPHVDEVQACQTFLQAQINQIAPKVILSVGRISAQSLLKSALPVGQLVKSIHQLPDAGIPLKVTYHPAYLLRNPSAKAVTWQDLKILYQMLKQ